jgi:N-acetylneuraminic acid mutarotase
MGACADPWEVVAPVGAPSARGRHVAVWADTVMMVWGGTTDTGVANNLNTGALYDPTTFTWKPTSLTNAPAPRQSATAIWTGTAVIVWGGRDGAVHFDSGAMYDPVANTWTPMATAAAPTPRINHTAVWTGSEMIVWGGRDAAGVQLNTGGRFDPATNSWVATEALSGPVHTRERHSAVWAGTEMWIYGGVGDAPPFMLGNSYWPTGPIPGGLRYSPSNGTWDVMPAMGQPTMRDRHTAVFDGLQMIVFGGFDGTDDNNTSFILDGGATVWTGTSGVAPAPRREHSAVWLPDATPPVMIVWGGRSSAGGVLNTGGVYVSTGNQWIEATPTALSPRVEHTAVSTGNTMIVWGGFDNNDGALGDGGIYIP